MVRLSAPPDSKSLTLYTPKHMTSTEKSTSPSNETVRETLLGKIQEWTAKAEKDFQARLTLEDYKSQLRRLDRGEPVQPVIEPGEDCIFCSG